ncbi:MAG: hypothetical protein JXD18_00310, partial [Anaerolineae bacterium]|nr:hypothetical protein [Anaerolineae bacterium]
PPPAYVTPPPPAQGGATAVLRESAPKRRPWLWIAIGGGLVALLVFVGVAWALLRGLGVFDGGVAEVTSQPPTSAPDTSATELAATMAALQATVGAPTATPTATSTPLPTPTSTPEPDLTATAYAACEFSVEVLEDPAVWPPILAPDQDFAKSWEVRNTGTCPWENGFQLAFVSGSQLGGPLAIPVDPTAANETWGVTLSLTAPSENGTYTGMWQLQTADGAAVGEPLAVSIVVGPTATPRPPTATPTPLASPTPPPALEMSWPSIISCWVDNDAGRWGGQIVWNAWGGPSTEYHYFYGGVASEQELATAGDSFSVQINSPLRVTYFTTSGVGVFWPLPEGCCGGSEGRWTSPEGYQVVWKAVQYDISRCP